MRYTIEHDGEPHVVDVDVIGPDTYSVRIDDAPARIVRATSSADVLHLIEGLKTREVRVGGTGAQRFAWSNGATHKLSVFSARAARIRARKRATSGASGALTICSPMPGRVVKVLVAKGDSVAIGQGVVIVEAMKMENELRAEAAGVVDEIKCAEGDLVGGGDELVVLSA